MTVRAFTGLNSDIAMGVGGRSHLIPGKMANGMAHLVIEKGCFK